MLKTILLLLPFLVASLTVSDWVAEYAPEIGEKTETITRNGKENPLVSYAYSKYGLDFVKTIEAESKWDLKAVWDGGSSYWLCQFHTRWNTPLQRKYRTAKSDIERVDICHDYYKAVLDNWTISRRLYGYRVRNLPQNSKPFEIKVFP